MRYLLLLCLFLNAVRSQHVMRWLSAMDVSALSTATSPQFCSQLGSLRILDRNQRGICKTNAKLMTFIAEGTRMAIDQCQDRFSDQQWNCSAPYQAHLRHVLTSNKGSRRTNRTRQVKRRVSKDFVIAKEGSREASFLYAVTSAGVTYSVTRACSTNKITSCGCDQSELEAAREKYKYAGCSENVRYGSGVAKRFLETNVKKQNVVRMGKKRLKRSEINMMNVHNSRAGRQLVEDTMIKRCKCHGHSGSCQLKTCWRIMQEFPDITAQLKHKFDSATFVQAITYDNGTRGLERVEAVVKPFTVSDLVYMQPSPNFCERNLRLGSLGTSGRMCKPEDQGSGGCKQMCCKRPTITVIQNRTEDCNCRFIYCCRVECDKCTVTEANTYCT